MSTPKESRITEKSDAFRKLANSKIFSELEPQHLLQIVKISQLQRFEQDQVILEERWLNTKLYIIVEGSAEVILPQKTGESSRIMDIKLAELGPSDSIGELSIIDNQSTSAKVIALTALTVIVITKDDFVDLLAKEEYLAMTLYKNLLKIITNRARNTILKVGFYDL